MPGEGATKEVFASPHSIFSQLPSSKGGFKSHKVF
jgi:hypothetical protein